MTKRAKAPESASPVKILKESTIPEEALQESTTSKEALQASITPDGLILRLAVAEKEGAQATWQAMAYNTLLVLDPIYNISGTAFACGEYFVKNDQKSFTDASGLSKTRDEGRIA